MKTLRKYTSVNRTATFTLLLVSATLISTGPTVAQLRRTVTQAINEYNHDFHADDSFAGVNECGGNRREIGDASRIEYAEGMLAFKPGANWCGVSDSLRGRLSNTSEVMNFKRALPAPIVSKYQALATGCQVRLRAVGGPINIKVEILNSDGTIVWVRELRVDNTTFKTFQFSIPAADRENLTRGKVFNLVCEPSQNELHVDFCRLKLRYPNIPMDEQACLIGLTQLLLNYDQTIAACRDRVHWDDLYNTASTGLFAMALQVAADQGFVPKTYADSQLRRIRTTFARLPRSSVGGVAPHQFRVGANGFEIAAGSHFSVLDTAIAYSFLLCAAEHSQQEVVAKSIENLFKAVNMDVLYDQDSYVVHGIMEDGVTRIPFNYREKSGEVVYVLVLDFVSQFLNEKIGRAEVDRFVEAHCLPGFVDQLHSMLFPHFDSPVRDFVFNTNWRGRRRAQYRLQESYFMSRFPGSGLASLGAFGLSATEGQSTVGDQGEDRGSYIVNGVADGCPVVPIAAIHYLNMSGVTRNNTATLYETFEQMEANKVLPPFGFPEFVELDGRTYHGFHGGWNAGLNFFGAYHALKKHRSEPDVVYDAAVQNGLLALAMTQFYQAE